VEQTLLILAALTITGCAAVQASVPGITLRSGVQNLACKQVRTFTNGEVNTGYFRISADVGLVVVQKAVTAFNTGFPMPAVYDPLFSLDTREKAMITTCVQVDGETGVHRDPVTIAISHTGDGPATAFLAGGSGYDGELAAILAESAK
jgi:hypothetical protein